MANKYYLGLDGLKTLIQKIVSYCESIKCECEPISAFDLEEMLGLPSVGDVVAWNGAKLELVRKQNIGNMDTSLTPVGIIVIPGSHNVYGDGSSLMMSLKLASCSDPDNGSLNRTHNDTNNIVYIYWGHGQPDQPDLGLTDYEEVIYNGGYLWDDDKGEYIYNSNIRNGNYACCLPTDRSNFGAEYIDPDGDQNSWYYLERGRDSYYVGDMWDDDYCYVPSPYNKYGLPNPLYRDTSYGSNALSDFDGKNNTTTICNAITVQDWQTASTIANNSAQGNYPAAACCWRYHTPGTTQGDWYLPACGELGYICVRQSLINESITALNNKFGNIAIALVFRSGDGYWASSEALLSAWSMEFDHGIILTINKSSRYWVRPVARFYM